MLCNYHTGASWGDGQEGEEREDQADGSQHIQAGSVQGVNGHSR